MEAKEPFVKKKRRRRFSYEAVSDVLCLFFCVALCRIASGGMLNVNSSNVNKCKTMQALHFARQRLIP